MKGQIEEGITRTDKQIDDIVYRLYDIDEAERRIIEGSQENGHEFFRGVSQEGLVIGTWTLFVVDLSLSTYNSDMQ